MADGTTVPKYKGLLGTVVIIAREEGLSALWKGIVPGLQRQCLYGGLRIGLYDPVSYGKNKIKNKKIKSFHELSSTIVD